MTEVWERYDFDYGWSWRKVQPTGRRVIRSGGAYPHVLIELHVQNRFLRLFKATRWVALTDLTTKVAETTVHGTFCINR